MKKAILFLFIISATAGASMAQGNGIPNAGFETWPVSSGPPAGWFIVNGTRLTADSVVTPHSSGQYALNLRTNTSNLGSAMTAFAFDQRPVAFEGYFGFDLNNPAENFEVVVALTRWDSLTSTRDTISYTEFNPVLAGADMAPWTLVQFNLDYDSLNLLSPDTAVIVIHTGGGSQNFAGTQLHVDDLSFRSTGAGIRKENGISIMKLHNYPNPVNTATEIFYDLQVSGAVSIIVYDISGKEVAVITEGYQASGEHIQQFDASALNNGVYFYRVQTGNAVETGRMMICH